MTTNTQRPQSQRHKRVAYPSEVALKEKNRPESDSGKVQNISVGGVFVVTDRKYLVGTPLTVYVPIDLGKRKSLCMITGKIVRSIPVEGGRMKFGYGIQFDIEVSKMSRELLASFVEFKSTGKAPEYSSKTRNQRFNPFRD